MLLPREGTVSPYADERYLLSRRASEPGVLARASPPTVRPDELERRLRARRDCSQAGPRAELLHVLMLPDFERADRIGEFWSYPESRTFAELLIDCEEATGCLRGSARWDAAGARTRALERT